MCIYFLIYNWCVIIWLNDFLNSILSNTQLQILILFVYLIIYSKVYIYSIYCFWNKWVAMKMVVFPILQDSAMEHLKLTITVLHGKQGPQHGRCRWNTTTWSTAFFFHVFCPFFLKPYFLLELQTAFIVNISLLAHYMCINTYRKNNVILQVHKREEWGDWDIALNEPPT